MAGTVRVRQGMGPTAPSAVRSGGAGGGTTTGAVRTRAGMGPTAPSAVRSGGRQGVSTSSVRAALSGSSSG